MKYLGSTLLICLFSITAVSQTITTVAGGYNGAGRNPLDIGIAPIGIAVDASGNVFIADPEKHVVRKLNAAGVYTIAAGAGIFGGAGDGGLATDARLKSPYAIAIDKNDNLLIADSYDHRIRKVTSDGRISTVAGNRTGGFSGDGGPAITAQLNGPNTLATDLAGNIYIGDFSNNRVRMVDVNGIITTIAGNGNFGSGGDGGNAALAELGWPIGLTTNAAGELFISDLSFNKIRKVAINGIISTVAGNGSPGGFSGDGGLATSAMFNSIEGSGFIDAAGNLYIPDTRNNRVRKVFANGIVQTIAGTGAAGFSGDESAATNAEIKTPTNVYGDVDGNLYISADNRIRKITIDGIIHTIAGNGSAGFSGNGMPGPVSQLFRSGGLATDATGNIYISDNGNNLVRKLDVNGILTIVAGNGKDGFSGDGGPAIAAQLAFPEGLAVDASGNLYIADFGNARIRKVTPSGIISSFAGNGIPSFSGDGGLATGAGLNAPVGIAADGMGNILIADRNNQRIRKVGTDGNIQTIAGNGTAGFGGDGGTALAAMLNLPVGVATSNSGDVFITDLSNFRVRKITASGIISTVAGNGSQNYSGDGGAATNAGLSPFSVSSDQVGNLYIADLDNGRIRKLSNDGTIATIVGGDTDYGDISAPGSPQLHTPRDVVMDGSGNLYVSDWDNHRVLKISQNSLPLDLLNFRASKLKNFVALAWETANEINTDNFIIQRSEDAAHFYPLGKMEAAAHGISQQYTYTDELSTSLSSTKVYYRLKMNDKDGKTTYSKVVVVKLDKQPSTFDMYPNPAKKVVFVNGFNTKAITITDMLGKQISYIQLHAGVTPIDISGFPNGIYFLQAMQNNGTIIVKKLMVH